MSTWFSILTVLFIIVSAAMVLIILVQRPQGGGLAGAFGGAGASGTETVFGGRVGDALTVMTVIAFALYLGLAVALNLIDTSPTAGPLPANAAVQVPVEETGTLPVTPVTIPPTSPPTSPPTALPVTPVAPPGGAPTPTGSDGNE